MALRYRLAGKRCLQGLQAHQEPPVLPQQVDEEPPLSGQEREHEHPAEEAQQLGRREGPEPGERAGAGSAFVALPEDEARNGSEDPVACKGLPPGRGGVQLAEAVAVGLAAASQVDADPTTNTNSSASAPTAPHQAVEAGMRVAATASSASGSSSPKGLREEASRSR